MKRKKKRKNILNKAIDSFSETLETIFCKKVKI